MEKASGVHSLLAWAENDDPRVRRYVTNLKRKQINERILLYYPYGPLK